MAHSKIIIHGVTDNEQQSIDVEYTPPDDLSEDDARTEARKWVRWVKRQYDDTYEHEERP